MPKLKGVDAKTKAIPALSPYLLVNQCLTARLCEVVERLLDKDRVHLHVFQSIRLQTFTPPSPQLAGIALIDLDARSSAQDSCNPSTHIGHHFYDASPALNEIKEERTPKISLG